MKIKLLAYVVVSVVLIIANTGCQKEVTQIAPQEIEIGDKSSEVPTIEIVKEPPTISYELIRKINKDMTNKEVIELIGEGQDMGSGIHIFEYKTEDGKRFTISVMNWADKIGKSGEELIQEMVE